MTEAVVEKKDAAVDIEDDVKDAEEFANTYKNLNKKQKETVGNIIVGMQLQKNIDSPKKGVM